MSCFFMGPTSALELVVGVLVGTGAGATCAVLCVTLEVPDELILAVEGLLTPTGVLPESIVALLS